MRPCSIAETAPDDWSVICDCVAVGRILRIHKPPDGKDWLWSITCHLRTSRADRAVSAASFDQAKAEFKAKWAEVDPDIEYERRADAALVERMRRFGSPVE
jgi:hypothetical protein